MSLRHRLSLVERQLRTLGTEAAFAAYDRVFVEAEERQAAAHAARAAGEWYNPADLDVADRLPAGPPGWIEARIREAALLDELGIDLPASDDQEDAR